MRKVNMPVSLSILGASKDIARYHTSMMDIVISMGPTSPVTFNVLVIDPGKDTEVLSKTFPYRKDLHHTLSQLLEQTTEMIDCDASIIDMETHVEFTIAFIEELHGYLTDQDINNLRGGIRPNTYLYVWKYNDTEQNALIQIYFTKQQIEILVEALREE